MPTLPGLPTPPTLTPQGLPEMPDVSGILDNLQEGINEIDVPKPPSMRDTGQFFLDIINNMAEKLGMPPPFPAPLPNPPSPPSPPAGLPSVPQVPKTAAPFKLPF